MTNQESRQMFRSQFSKIKDQNIFRIVTEMYNTDRIQDYFFNVPSSSSGKYHPEDELDPGGLVLHTVRCVKVAEVMSRMWQLSDYELDLAIAALLLHDTCKNGLQADTGHTQFNHPLLAAKNLMMLDTIYFNRCYIKTAKKIAKLIKSHMGQWNTNSHEPKVKLPIPKTKLEKFVHECDYIASRKDFNIIIDYTPPESPESSQG